MNRLYQFFALLFLFAANTLQAGAQAINTPPTTVEKDTTGTTIIKKANLRIGASFVNNNVFYGRSDTARTAILSPNLKYTFANGLYVSGSLSIIPKQTKKLNGGALTAGYDGDITDDLSFGASVSKVFYNSTSTQVGSSVRGIVSGSLDYDLGDILTASFGADYYFNSNVDNDALLSFGLSHDFIAKGVFGDKDFLLISPTIALNAGTQNFYDDFLITNKKKNLKAYQAQTVQLNAYKNQLSQFNMLDYEISASVIYKLSPVIISFVPTYAIAKNKLPKGVLSGVSSENNLFYFQAGVALKF